MSEEHPQHPRSRRKAPKKLRRLLTSSGLQTMKGCRRRITNRGLSSIHRSRPRGLKRLRKPRVPSELKATVSSSCSHVGGIVCALWVSEIYKARTRCRRCKKKCQEKANNLLESATTPTTSLACSTTLRREGRSTSST
jgi:hypothetical protein